jgi:hypothetical protein
MAALKQSLEGPAKKPEPSKAKPKAAPRKKAS